MYPTSTARSLPPLSLHLGNLPGFEFSSDRETPISNPPSSVFSGRSAATSALSSTSISPLNLLSATPINQSIPVCQRTGPNHLLQRASTLPLANLPPVPRITTPAHCQLPEGFQKCSFVDSLVGQRSQSLLYLLLDTGALVIETIWPNQTIPILNSKILPLRVFIQETIRRSRTSFSTLQLALYYLLRIKSAVHDFEKQNPDWFNGPCNFGKTASKHPIACGRRMFLAAVIVASKYLQDRNYSNRAWAKISGLPVKEINANEFVFLKIAKYELYVGEALYKRWSGVLLNHVMATVSVSAAAAATIPQVGLATPPLTPIMSPLQAPPTPSALHTPNTLRIALAQRFCDAIRNLSPQLTEAELSSLHVLGFQSPQQKSMSPPPSRNGLGQLQRTFNTPAFPLNPLLSQSRVPSYDAALTPPSSSASDSASDSETWSPKSSVSSASSNDQTNISPRTNLGRSYLKNLGCPNANSAKTQSIAPSCLSKRCASPLSILAACNDRKRIHPMSDSPMSMEDVRPQLPPSTPRLGQAATPASSYEDADWCSSAAGTVDPKLLSLNSSALTAVKGLCSLSQKATVFQPSGLSATSSLASGGKRAFGKSYSMGNVQSDYEPAKRRRGAISDQTLARVL